jgi:hypothetical protein
MLKIAITARVEWLTPVILATQEAGIRRITVQADPRQTVRETPISKILNTKRAGRVTQVVGCPHSKHEALSSNPRTTHIKKKKIASTIVQTTNYMQL